MPAWTDEEEYQITLYYENVHNFIPWNVIEFVHEHSYSETYNIALNYLEQDCRYSEAIRRYDEFMSYFSSGSNNEGYS